jgi:hypothetical protein
LFNQYTHFLVHRPDHAPAGLYIIYDFLSFDEEAALVAHFDTNGPEWDTHLARRVKHFGETFDYVTRQVRFLLF